MSWFKKREKEKPPENLFEELFPLESRFNYRGIEMIVVGHWDCIVAFGEIIKYPYLKAEYVDEVKVFHNVGFRLHELEILKKENRIL